MAFSGRINMLLFGFLLSACLLYNVTARQENSCRLNGEYCQTHWECCSRKCMTYSYVCAGVSGSNPNKVPLNYYNDLLQHWWAVQEKRPLEQKIQIVTLQDEKPTQEEKVGNEYQILYDPLIDTLKRKECKGIGQFCTDGTDCCTKRCHSYLHKCVT